MLTKNQIKLIKSLHEKKNRNEQGLFLVEGSKGVLELLNSDLEIIQLLVTNKFYEENKDQIKSKEVNTEIIEQEVLQKMSYFETNDSALAVVRQRSSSEVKNESTGITLVLDEIKDPGNLGTIVRIADWYGIKEIIASENTVDFYNPKVISASMGSFTRVSVTYKNLETFLSETKEPIFGAYMDGKDIHKIKFPDTGILIMGNESNGISESLKKFITEKITIPRVGKAESLNVSIATAIICDNWTSSLNI